MAVDHHLQGAVMIAAVFLGVFGNLPIILSICRKRSLLKNNHYYLILHLAICDFFFLLFFVPDIYSTFSQSPWISSTSYFLCKTLSPTHTVFLNAGANFLVLISILRYRGIVKPLEPAVTRKRLKIFSCLVYIFSIICVIPYVVVLKFDGKYGCYEEWSTESHSLAYTIFLAGVQYFIPSIFLSITYMKIGMEIFTRNKRISPMVDAQQKNLKNVKPLIVSFTIVVCFITSGLPSQILYIVCATTVMEPPSYTLLFDALYLFGTAVINPYVYGAIDRKAFSFFATCTEDTLACI